MTAQGPTPVHVSPAAADGSRAGPGRRCRARRRRGRLLLVPAVALLALAGCGQEAGAPADPPAASQPSSSGAPAPGTPPEVVTPGATPTPGGVPTDPADPADVAGTQLQVVVDDGSGAVTTSTLTCGPDGGDLADPVGACTALADAGGAQALAPPARDVVCTEQYGGPQTASVSGTVAGQPVSAQLSRTDGCGISRWEALVPLVPSAGA